MALGKNLKRTKLIPDVPEDKQVKEETKKKKPAQKPVAKKSEQENKPTRKPAVRKSAPKAKSTAVTKTKAPEPIKVATSEIPHAKKGKKLSEKEIKERETRRIAYLNELQSLKSKNTTWIMFEVSGEYFAIDINKAQEIIQTPTLSGLPHTESHIVGVAQVRRRPVLFIDFANKFNLKGEGKERDYSFALVIKPVKDWVAVLLNKVPQTLKIPGNQLIPVPSTVNLIQGKDSYIKFMHKHEGKMVYVLDIEGLILSDQGIREARFTPSTQPA